MSFPGCSEGGLTGTHWGFQEPPACARGGAQGQAEAVQHADAWKPGPREARTGLAWARAPGLLPAPALGSRLAFCSLSPTSCPWETGVVATLLPPWLVGRVESENLCKAPGVKAPAPTSELS